MRESWTDKRLDERFNGIDQRLDNLERRMEAGFARVDADIRALRVEMGAFQRMILQLGAGSIVTIALGFAGLIVAQL